MRSLILALAFTALPFANASISYDFRLQADDNCVSTPGTSSIPVLTCYISLGVSTKDAQMSDFDYELDLDSLPFFSDYGAELELSPQVSELNGKYVLIVNFLDDSLDGYDASEASVFKNAVIESLKNENITVKVIVRRTSLEVDNSLGQVLPFN